MDTIVAYLKTSEQPEDKKEGWILRLKEAHYVLYDDELYRRGYSMPLLKCVTPSYEKYIIREIHDGTRGNHARGQSLAFKALRQGYYWPTMKHGARPQMRQVLAIYTNIESSSGGIYVHD